MKARDNPFSVDRVLTVRYRPVSCDWPAITHRLVSFDYRAAIVGPHGSGKTTLLEELVPVVKRLGLRPVILMMDNHDTAVDMTKLRTTVEGLTPSDVLLLDGADRLSLPRWWHVARQTRRARGLVITSHRAGRLPTLVRTATSAKLLDSIVTELHPPSLDVVRSRELFARHRGNLRDALRELYDYYALV